MREGQIRAIRTMVKRRDTPKQVAATALPVQRPAVPLLLRVPAALLAADETQVLTRSLEEVLDEFQLGLGLSLPRIHVHGQAGGAAAAATQWELLAFAVPIARCEITPDAP